MILIPIRHFDVKADTDIFLLEEDFHFVVDLDEFFHDFSFHISKKLI